MAKKYRGSAFTYEAQKYKILGCREKWLREQKERDRKYKEANKNE